VILPLIAVLFLAIHFWRIRKDGGLHIGVDGGGETDE
jgi:hypothetical protein